MARALRARVCAMYAAMPITYTAASEAGPIISRAALADELKDYHRRLKAIEKQFAEDGIQAVGLVVEGNPVEQILREATRRNAGMIVIGSTATAPSITCCSAASAPACSSGRPAPFWWSPHARRPGPSPSRPNRSRRPAGDTLATRTKSAPVVRVRVDGRRRQHLRPRFVATRTGAPLAI